MFALLLDMIVNAAYVGLFHGHAAQGGRKSGPMTRLPVLGAIAGSNAVK
jgi:hypothetical protein